MKFDRRYVLGVPVDVVTAVDVLNAVRESVEDRRPMQIVTVNAEFVVRAQGDDEFARVLGGASLATPDGAGVVWALRRKGAHIERRVGGSDLIWSISHQARLRGHRIFLLGGADGVAKEAARRLQAAYSGLQIAGWYAGSPAAVEEDGIVDLIRRAETDILFVAFGAPSQDIWIARNLKRTGAVVGIGVGGSFDYVAGRARRAPVWMQDHGMDWAWRLAHQPRRWRRMLALPRFVWLVLRREERIRI